MSQLFTFVAEEEEKPLDILKLFYRKFGMMNIPILSRNPSAYIYFKYIRDMEPEWYSRHKDVVVD